jgi:hypothetical protein
MRFASITYVDMTSIKNKAWALEEFGEEYLPQFVISLLFALTAKV